MLKKILRAVAYTALVLLCALAAGFMSLVVQTGVDLSVGSNMLVFWAILGVIAVGALAAIARIWIDEFRDER